MGRQESRSKSTSVSWHRDDESTILRIRVPWHRNTPYLGLAAVAWLAAVWNLGYLKASAPMGALAILPALPLLYLFLVGWLHRWTLTFNSDILSVTAGPLPWKGKTSLRTRELTTLGLDKVMGRHGRPATYTLEARLADGTARAVLRGLYKPAAVRVLDILAANTPREAGDSTSPSF